MTSQLFMVGQGLSQQVPGCLLGTLVHEKYLFWGESFGQNFLKILIISRYLKSFILNDN